MKDSLTKTICFFNSNKAWGGGEKWHLNTCKEFQRIGINTILVTNEGSELAKKGMQEGQNTYRFRIGNLSFLNPIKIFVFVLFFKFKKVDAVIMNLPSDLKVAGIAAKIAGVKKIIYRRGMPHPLRDTFLNRFLFLKIIDHVIVNSKEIGLRLKKGNERWFPEDKMLLIYNGVDTDAVVEKEKKLFEKKSNEIVIGNAGRLTEQKGQKYLIELAKLLKKDDFHFKMFIAGEGELKDFLRELIIKENLQNEVKLLGHVNDMSAFFNSLDVFVFTSLFEGSANTLIETLHHEVPTVAWDVSSNPEIIVDKETGFLIPPYDVGKMKDIIQNELTEEKREKMKSQGLKYLKEHFDYRKNLETLKSII